MSSLRGRVIALAVGTALAVILLAAVPIAVLRYAQAQTEAEAEATLAAQSAADYLSLGEGDLEGATAYVQRLNQRRGQDDPQVTMLLPNGSQIGAPLPAEVLTAITAASSSSNDSTNAQSNTDDDDVSGNDGGNASTAASSPRQISVPGGRVVQVVAQTASGRASAVAFARDAPVQATLAQQYGIGAAVAVAILLLAWAGAELTGRRLIRPLQLTADTAIALRDGDLAARAPVEGPSEVAAVAIELNALAARIGELLTQEREAAADLSHRLRTPLMSVRLSVERLPDSPQRGEVEGDLDRLERMLTRIIHAARRGVREGVHPRCDAAAVVAERGAFWRPLAEDQERAVTIDVPGEPVWVRSTVDDLGSALDALIENVIAHTAQGTAFRVKLTATSYGADLVVRDDGPGIPRAALERGMSDRGSTGLGLDVARSVAEAAGGTLELVDADATGRAHGVLLRLHADAAGGPPAGHAGRSASRA
ncbi:HAMP domain-containing sensor histidine kinase [Microbacterium sp. X-17]|uniref:sensor histidine kinase n=1 Tax=Microbacterium sp. X-17 TaxID=3144404 RepID=UPI0031F56B85